MAPTVPPEDEEGPLWSGRLLSEIEIPFDLRPAWQREDREVEQDAIAFWNRLGVLPSGVDPATRARQLAAVAYRDQRPAAVSTVVLDRLDQLKGRFAFLRCAVDPDFRRSYAARALTKYTRDLIEEWSAAHPEEKILGLCAIIQSRQLTRRQRCPLWVNTHLNLVGHTPRGEQIRISWFAHAEVETGRTDLASRP